MNIQLYRTFLAHYSTPSITNNTVNSTRNIVQRYIMKIKIIFLMFEHEILLVRVEPFTTVPPVRLLKHPQINCLTNICVPSKAVR